MSDDPFALLHAARATFGPRARAEKRALLERCGERLPSGARRVRQFHDTLLFLAAYPDDRDLLEHVEEYLHRLAEAVRAGRAPRLDGTGIAGTATVTTFTIDSARWLLQRFPGDVDIDWDDDEAVADRLEALLPLCVTRAERDGLLDSSLSTQEWFALAAGGPGRDLPWLLDRIDAWAAPDDLVDHLFDALELPVRWRLTAPVASVTFARFPARSTQFVRGPLRRRVDLPRLARRPLPEVKPLPRGRAGTLIETARIALLARGRETDPVIHAHRDDVTLVSLERGIDVALFGLQPARRRPVESFIGYVVARNRVPLGYGGAWIAFDTAEIGVNVFDAFRGGESALLFAQIIRVYHQHFRVRRFLVDPFQFGAGNPEGIRSGAYWFYYRLGFRSVEPDLAAVAKTEWSRIRDTPGYRSPATVLRRLAKGKIALELGTGRDRAMNSPDLAALSLAMTRAIGERFGGDRTAAARWARRRLRTLLGPLPVRAWSEAEREAFDSLAPMVALAPGLDRWPRAALRALVPLLRAKGGRRERPFVLALQRHARIAAAWCELANADGRDEH